jgi:RimJ/RimL family protein N-acetyltransferase
VTGLPGKASPGEPGQVLTARLDLRAVRLADAGALHRILGDPRNAGYIPGGALEGPADTLAWIERFRSGWDLAGLGYWTVRLRATGTVIGVGGAERRAEFWNLFYFIGRDHWGNGYASALAAAARDAARARDPGLPLAAWIHQGDVASRAVARRLGLRDHGRLEAGHWKGEPMHCWADREPGSWPGRRRAQAG